jgi:hypothetical protein
MEAYLQYPLAMNPDSEVTGEPNSSEFVAFSRLVDVLLSVSRADLQKKLQGAVTEEAEKP